MNRPALHFLALLLSGCTPAPPQPSPAPLLTLTRLDAVHVGATLTPPPVSGHWTLAASAECGAQDGPGTGGEWPQTGGVTVMAGRGDLFTATVVTPRGHTVTVADCVPEVAWNQGGSAPLIPIPIESPRFGG